MEIYENAYTLLKNLPFGLNNLFKTQLIWNDRVRTRLLFSTEKTEYVNFSKQIVLINKRKSH